MLSSIFITWLVFCLTVLFMLPALGLVFIPVFPALFYLLILSLVYGLIDGFHHLSGIIFVCLILIYFLSFLVDLLSGLIGAKIFGASKKALLGAIIGGIVGIVLLPPFGVLLGIFLGVLIVELLHMKNYKDSLIAAGGAVIGTMTGMAVNFFLALSFILIFTISVLVKII